MQWKFLVTVGDWVFKYRLCLSAVVNVRTSVNCVLYPLDGQPKCKLCIGSRFRSGLQLIDELCGNSPVTPPCSCGNFSDRFALRVVNPVGAMNLLFAYIGVISLDNSPVPELFEA
jgi:hypothetical protein